MQIKRNLTTSPQFHGLPILTNADRGEAVDTDILSRIERQFEHAEATKTKTFFMRLDLHYPQTMDVPQDNDHFRHFASAFKKNLSRQGLKPQYVAVREQDESVHQHYHMALFLDGQKTRNCYGHLKTAERLWGHELNVQDGRGLVNFCDKDRDGSLMKNGMMMDPNKDDYETVRDKCFQRASYLAKTSQKNTPKGQREYFASKLPRGYRQ